jgi:nucleoside-diphosphate-sugar epimerase
LLDKHNTVFPIIVAPFENLTIAEMAQILVKQTNKKLTLVFNGMTDGQFRKDGSNKELMDLLSGLEFTPYEVGIKKTYDWYVENQRNG